MFRRRRRDPAEPAAEEPVADAAEPADPAEPDEEPPAGTGGGEDPPARPEGPWDEADAPADAVERIDLGGLRMPVPEGMQLQVQVQQEVVVPTLIDGRSGLEVTAFAAPRSSGIWTEIRAEIAESLRTGGGTAQDADGPFGTELHAVVPAEVPGQGMVRHPVRFVGVDGPRWFCRGVFSGAAATDPVAAAPLEAAFRGVVVVRGGDAMAPRDPLPLRLPREAAEAAGMPPGPEGDPLNPFARGPEITEVR